MDENMEKYNSQKPIAKYKVGDRFITTINKLMPNHNGYGYYVDYMMDTDPNISEKEDAFCGGWRTRQELLDGMVYLGGRFEGEEPAKKLIDKLNCIELKAALWRSIENMQKTLNVKNARCTWNANKSRRNVGRVFWKNY